MATKQTTTGRDLAMVEAELQLAIDRCRGIVEMCRIAAVAQAQQLASAVPTAHLAETSNALGAARAELERVQSLIDELGHVAEAAL